MAYRFVDHTQAAAELAKKYKKPVLYISWDMEAFPDFGPIFQAAPYLKEAFGQEQKERDNPTQCMIESKAIIICDTQHERDKLFDMTVGDDGPTDLNPYSGPARVYALTISRTGEFLNENT